MIGYSIDRRCLTNDAMFVPDIISEPSFRRCKPVTCQVIWILKYVVMIQYLMRSLQTCPALGTFYPSSPPVSGIGRGRKLLPRVLNPPTLP